MYKLIAEFNTHLYGIEPHEEVVARFTTREAAKEYIKAARLKNGAPRLGESPFRSASLLKDADNAWIEVEEVNLDIPVDPVLND